MERQIYDMIEWNVDYDNQCFNMDIAAKEITSHITEFMEWCLMDVGKEYKSYNSNILHYYTIPKTEEIWFDSIEEIYQYWLKNVKQ